MSLILTDRQEVDLAVEFRSKAGNPAPVDGVPEWESSDTSIMTVTPSADGLSAVATTVGPVGHVQISVTADADLGEGVRHISGVLEINVEPSGAVSAALSAGEPRDRDEGAED